MNFVMFGNSEIIQMKDSAASKVDFLSIVMESSNLTIIFE